MAWGLPSYHLGELALMVVGRSDAANVWLHAGPLALITIGRGDLRLDRPRPSRRLTAASVCVDSSP
jgi:hypothetical protein